MMRLSQILTGKRLLLRQSPPKAFRMTGKIHSTSCGTDNPRNAATQFPFSSPSRMTLTVVLLRIEKTFGYSSTNLRDRPYPKIVWQEASHEQ